MRITRTQRWGLFGAVGLLAVGMVAGPALAQDADDAPPPGDEQVERGAVRDEMREALAAELGITVEELEAAHEAARTAVFLDHLDEAVDSGRFTEEEAEELRAAAEAGELRETLDALRLERLEARLAEKVEAGDLSQEEADEILEQAQNGEFPRFGRHGRHGQGPGGRFGRGGPGGPGGPGPFGQGQPQADTTSA